MLITQMAQTAVCNRHHTLDQQLCRWLLLSLDRLGTEDDDDKPEDERPGENEASERETDDAIEAPGEFEADHEDDRTPR